MPLIFEAPVSIERILTAILVISLVLVVFSVRPKLSYLLAITAIGLLIFFDQMRLQPWVYQYLLILSILALHEWQTDESVASQAISLVQLVVAGLYFWSGVQKLNYTFLHESLSTLLDPLKTFLPSDVSFVLLGVALASIETLIGVGLLFRKTRNLSVLLAVGMHTIILSLLIAINYNSIVWPWNVTLIAIVVVTFWKNDVSIGQIFTTASLNTWKTNTASFITVTLVLLPVLSFANLWDMYLSGALYSGNVEVGVVRIDDALVEKLPRTAREIVFRTKTAGELMLPLHEWALNDLNVPVYPERRVFMKVGKEICSLTNNPQVELMVKGRPTIIDGTYSTMRIKCSAIEKN